MYVSYVKRPLDICLSIVAFLLLFPVFTYLSIVLLCKQGKPVLFKQDRLGKDSKPFRIHKFRTMPTDIASPQFSFQTIPDTFTFPQPLTTSLTPLQQKLRASGLDELPQLLEIITGKMSIVGPRPEQSDLASRYSAHHQKRLQVRPGLTGLAQIRGRETMRYRHKIRYDLFYIQHASFRLDCWIIWQSLLICIAALRRKRN